MSVRLGPFQLQEPVGAGAMGVVYRARHVEQGVPVAVKVDTTSADPGANAAFLHEVQVTAALDHPNVVMILDHGVVDGAAARGASRLVEGARWLAMELAPGGTAADRVPRSWSEVMHLMRGVLGGLAHAHARGVVHRDIKLQNLLLGSPDGSFGSPPIAFEDARIVVSDFGVADLSGASAMKSEKPIGTPEYMAPELIEGRWRDQGPWTDIYAVGVLLYLLTVRTFPFAGADRFETYAAHLHDPIPRGMPLMSVPDGIGDLITTLLSKDPAGRPEFAAEVLRSLEALGSPPLDDDDQDGMDGADVATVSVPDLPLFTGRSYAGRSRSTLGQVPLLHGGRRRDTRMESAGLALFGLRSVPFVGREAECDRLWNELVAIRTRPRARCVLLRGPSGIGKTRIAEWLAQRSHELGVAVTLRASHGPGLPSGAGLIGMLRAELQTQDLGPAELEQRLHDRFPDAVFDVRALAATLEPSAYPQRAPTSPAELRQLVISVLAEVSRPSDASGDPSGVRPVIVVLDDVQHDIAALELVDSLLVVQEFLARPVLVLVTVGDEDLPDLPDVRELLEEIQEDPQASQIVLAPLDAQGRRRLVGSLLGLDGALAERIEQRTGGNPMFARQLVGAWVEQGVLVPGPSGFRLADGHTGELPADVAAVWRLRLDAALAGARSSEVEGILMAAAWGVDVVHERWIGSCAVLELDPGDRLLDALRKRHLVHLDVPDGSRWHFVHGALRELLVARSKAAGRWQRDNLAIAIWLRESGAPVPAAQRARHFIEAEVWEDAIEPLCEAIDDQVDSGDLRNPALVDALQDVLDRLGLTGSSRPWAELQILRAIRHRARGELDDAEELALEVAEAAPRRRWGRDIEAKALREAARVAFARGEYEPALELARRAEHGFLVRGDRLRAADCETVIGNILLATARLDEAERAFVHAIQAYEDKSPERASTAMIGMVRLSIRRGAGESTAGWLSLTRERAEEFGLQLTQAVCANLEGELARAAGDPEGAARHYRVAIERYRALESGDFVYPSLNLGILDVLAGRHEAAIQRMQPLLLHLRRHPHELLLACTHMVMMAAFAGLGDHQASVGSFGVIHAHVEATGFVDPDLAAMAEVTASAMRARGWDQHHEVCALAVSQYMACGREEDAVRLLRANNG